MSLGGRVVAAVSPPMGFEIGGDEDAAAMATLRQAAPRIVLVGLGAPKQEAWMARHAHELPNSVMLGIGQAIDVLGGRVPPAPAWMTRVGLEWAFRMCATRGASAGASSSTIRRSSGGCSRSGSADAELLRPDDRLGLIPTSTLAQSALILAGVSETAAENIQAAEPASGSPVRFSPARWLDQRDDALIARLRLLGLGRFWRAPPGGLGRRLAFAA